MALALVSGKPFNLPTDNAVPSTNAHGRPYCRLTATTVLMNDLYGRNYPYHITNTTVHYPCPYIYIILYGVVAYYALPCSAGL